MATNKKNGYRVEYIHAAALPLLEEKVNAALSRGGETSGGIRCVPVVTRNGCRVMVGGVTAFHFVQAVQFGRAVRVAGDLSTMLDAVRRLLPGLLPASPPPAALKLPVLRPRRG